MTTSSKTNKSRKDKKEVTKITRTYAVDEMYIAFVDMKNAKEKGMSGTMSFTREGRKNNDIKIKIVYTK